VSIKRLRDYEFYYKFLFADISIREYTGFMISPNEEQMYIILARALIKETIGACAWVWKAFRKRLELPGERKDILSSKFLRDHGEYVLVPGGEYKTTLNQAPVVPTRYGYPHDIEALRSFSSLLPNRTYYKQTLWEQKIPITSKVVSSGSPKSSVSARQFLPFYEIDSKNIRLLYQTEIQPESVTYNFGEDLSAPQVSVISKMRGNIPDRKYRKALITRSANGIRFWSPKGYLNGDWLEKDFLLVSRLPRNPNGGNILIFSGAHGAGTEATRLMFYKLRISELKELERFISNTPYYQFVIEVDKIEHKRTGTVPIHVRLSNELPPVKLEPKWDIKYYTASKSEEN
jgi:hypothetical protein